MKTKSTVPVTKTIICFYTILTYFLSIAILTAAENQSITNQQELIMMQDFLFKVGDRFNCYFTIEVVNKNDGAPTLHRSLIDARAWIVSDPKVHSINDLITVLSNRLANFAIITNNKNHKILHIIQKELYIRKDYVLNDVTTLKYRGSLGNSQNIGLGAALGQRLSDRIGPCTIGVLNNTLFDDYSTLVMVDAKNSAVRDILTDFVPVQNYKRIIWLAETSTQDAQPKTTIQYFGPKTKIAQPKS